MEPEEQHISYRPSKKFLIRGGVAAGIILLALLIQADWFRALFNKKPKPPIINPNETISSLIGKDTNGNTIPDWEERLWGLDPTVLYTNGVSNKQIIEDRKKVLGITDATDIPLTETDILAQQLFSLASTLDQTGQGDSGAITAVGVDLGNSVKVKPIMNHYSLKDVKTVATSSASVGSYYASVTKVVSTYKSETSSIDIIVAAVETGDFSNIEAIKETADLYVSFSKALQKIPTPIGIADYHLAMINGFYGMAASFDYITQIEDNGVNALAGIAIYQNYSTIVGQALSDLDDYFTDYGIINE